MKTLSKFFTLILCLELIVSPIMPSLSLLGPKAYAQQNCGAGMQFDSTLNRCLTTAETAKVLNATASCAAGDSECYINNAKQAFNEKADGDKKYKKPGDNQLVSSIANIASIAGPVTIVVAGLSKTTASCKSKSFYAMIAGAAALFIGDTMANMKHKSNLETIEEDWGKIVNPEQAKGDKDKIREASLESQAESFEMLARAEDSLAGAAKTKQIAYYAATLAYGVSGVLAWMEISQHKTLIGLQDTAKTAYDAAMADPTGAARETARANYIQATTNRQTHELNHRCITKSADAVVKFAPHHKGLFEYYTSTNSFNLREDIQFRYNLRNSSDLASFVMNEQEMNGTLTSPLEEYAETKEMLKELEPNDPSVFELFKESSIIVLNQLNPLPTVYARVDAISNDESLSGSGGGGGGGSSSSANNKSNKDKESEVDSNAAKAFKEFGGKGFNWMGLAMGAGVGAAVGLSGIGKKMMSSEARLAFSAVMAGLTLQMALHAGSQAKASKNRAELLRQMKEEFNTASGAVYACKSEDRNDPGKPNCYCYTPENQRNPNRGSSQVCQKLWTGKSFNATNYLAGTGTTTRICVSNQNKPDPTCACKQTKTCMKVGVGGITGLNPGTMSVLSSALGPVNGINSGSVDAANLDAAAMANQAARLNSLNDKIKNSKAFAGLKKKSKRAELQIKNDLERAAASLPASSLLGASGSNNLPSNPGDAARMLEKELESNVPISIGGGGNTLAAPSNQAPEDGFEFGLTPDQFAAQQGQIAELMKEDLDYGSNDINQGSNTNLFEVLSNRYQRSGMRRLFDEEGKTKADKAAQTDIVQ